MTEQDPQMQGGEVGQDPATIVAAHVGPMAVGRQVEQQEMVPTVRPTTAAQMAHARAAIQAAGLRLGNFDGMGG